MTDTTPQTTDVSDVYDGLLDAGWTTDADGNLRSGRAMWTQLDDDGESAVKLDGTGGAETWAVWFPTEVPATVVLAVAQAAVALDKAETPTTDTLAARLIDAATAAGLVPAHAIGYANGHADVHVRPASMGEWQQWCDLVSVDGGSIRTPAGRAFTCGVGTFGDTRITLYGHGVWALWDAERATSGRVAGPAHDTTGDAP